MKKLINSILNAFKRRADFAIGGWDDPYLLRWWVIPRNSFFNIYLHKFLRDDDDRALHDHPWVSCSIVLAGGYLEHVPFNGNTQTSIVIPRKPGSIVFRKATQAHRIELYRCFYRPLRGWRALPAWSLFITGPRIRSWGFHCPGGWRHWREFTAGDDGALVGKGCEGLEKRFPQDE